jgi:hypothetical protein
MTATRDMSGHHGFLCWPNQSLPGPGRAVLPDDILDLLLCLQDSLFGAAVGDCVLQALTVSMPT